LAVILGIAAILIGLVVTFDVPRHLQVDSCLDGGGSFDYEKNVCDFSVSHPIRTQGLLTSESSSLPSVARLANGKAVCSRLIRGVR
jgi:hypothetical protein